MITVSPRITAKIATLLANVQKDARAGNLEAARVASATANEIAAKDGRIRIYIVENRGSEYVNNMMTTPDYCVPEYWAYSAHDAWAARVRRSAEANFTVDPKTHVVVGFIHTGVVDKNGAHEFLPDWADCTDATSLGS